MIFEHQDLQEFTVLVFDPSFVFCSCEPGGGGGTRVRPQRGLLYKRRYRLLAYVDPGRRIPTSTPPVIMQKRKRSCAEYLLLCLTRFGKPDRMKPGHQLDFN